MQEGSWWGRALDRLIEILLGRWRDIQAWT